MIAGMRYMSRSMFLATLLLAGMIPANSPARMPASTSPHPGARAAAPDMAAPGQSVARYEVRLRKLHLVRPDLIQYPISYDVYC